MPADEMEQLAFKNRFVRQLVQTMTDYEASDATPQIVSGPDNMIILQVSLEEWIKLTSSVFTGADICYPDESDSVRWILFRAVEQPVDLCALIAQCIENSPATRAAIRDLVLTDPEINQHITNIAANQVLSLENRLQNLLKPEQCDPDFIFNQSSVLVQLLHDLSEDMFEAIEVGTNQLERADILVSAVPAAGLNDTAATVFRAADQLAEEVQEDYMGAYDEAMFDALRCAVFCACKDDCELSLTKIIDVYKALLEAEIPTDPIEALVFVIGFIATGDIPTDATVYVMHLFMLTAIQAGTNLLGVDFSKLANRILAAGDDPNNDWELLCEDCPPEPDDCVDLMASDGGYAPVFAGRAEYHAGEGWGRAPVNASYMWIRRNFAGSTINQVVLDLSASLAGLGTIFVALYAYDDVGQAFPVASSITGLQTYTFPGLTLTDGMIIYISTGGTLPEDLRLVEICYEFAE